MLHSMSAKMVALYKKSGAWSAECRRKQTCALYICFVQMNFKICHWQELSGLPAQYLRSCIWTIFHSSCRGRRYSGNIPMDWSIPVKPGGGRAPPSCLDGAQLPAPGAPPALFWFTSLEWKFIETNRHMKSNWNLRSNTFESSKFEPTITTIYTTTDILLIINNVITHNITCKYLIIVTISVLDDISLHSINMLIFQLILQR